MVRGGRPSRLALRPAGRSAARPMAYRPGSGSRRPTPLVGWAAAGLAVVAFVWLSGLAGSDAELASPSPSPTPSGPIAIRFGTERDPATGEARAPALRFRAGDALVYSVRLAEAPGVSTILVEIIRLEASGETVVQEPSEQGIDGTSRVFAFEPRAVDLLAAWGPGEFEMRIYFDGAAEPFAAGRFTLVESPAEP